MKTFLDDNFLLENRTAEHLYHAHARDLPIIDYHGHLSPADLAHNRSFETLTDIWLEGDHYKWRAMRTHGVSEDYCTGDADPKEKFLKWAETVPYTLRNPLYHWTHMELLRPFGIRKILKPETAEEIYALCNEKLASPAFSTRGILQQMNVEVVCTTDDPIDDLAHHAALAAEETSFRMFPSFRPDKAMLIGDPASYNAYLDKLSATTNTQLDHFLDLLSALQQRVDYFHEHGCRLADHGLTQLATAPFQYTEINHIFHKVRLGHMPTADEQARFLAAVLLHLGEMYHEKGWTQQFHLGAMRNNNSRMMRRLGPDTGFDSIGDYPQAGSLAGLLDQLDSQNKLAKTILYNLNPADNALMGTMIGNFNDGSIPGKMQWGSAWWFLDTKNGMETQLNTLSELGLLSHFVGMLTDSRSFLSFPRHEYFRRILCNLIGQDVEKGLLPNDLEWLGHIIERICYYNARSYFGFDMG